MIVALLGALGGSWGALLSLLGALKGSWGTLWSLLGFFFLEFLMFLRLLVALFWACSGLLWLALAALIEQLEFKFKIDFGMLGRSLGALGRSWAALGGLLGRSGALGTLGRLLGRFLRLLHGSWSALGGAEVGFG